MSTYLDKRSATPLTTTACLDELFDATGFLDNPAAESRRSRLLNLFYLVKPLIPRQLQLAVRRSLARHQAARRFPAWPIEPLLVERQAQLFRTEMQRRGSDRVPFINFWPDGKRFAYIVTHDVEGLAGVDNIAAVLEIERRHGIVSSWNFVAEDYPIDPALFDRLRSAGCEIGLHGVHHDGRLFRDRARFVGQLPLIHHYLREWNAVGFRSPATHRNVTWMPELECLYDSSFPDTDPFEPQPGGCCSIWPFFLGSLVELPITMPQDHTLFEILGESSIQRWIEKSDWIIEHHGLITMLVHPDYLIDRSRLDLYEQLLVRLAARSDGWHDLPREVAKWWRERAQLQAAGPAEDTSLGHPLSAQATVAHAYLKGGDVAFGL